jgi:hypothetical protein
VFKRRPAGAAAAAVHIFRCPQKIEMPKAAPIFTPGLPSLKLSKPPSTGKKSFVTPARAGLPAFDALAVRANARAFFLRLRGRARLRALTPAPAPSRPPAQTQHASEVRVLRARVSDKAAKADLRRREALAVRDKGAQALGKVGAKTAYLQKTGAATEAEYDDVHTTMINTQSA